MTPSLVVHHLGVSQSERIVWLCEELELPYELKIYDRDPTTRMAPAAYKALHPMGIAPVIADGGRLISESGAIVDYIVQRYGGGRLAVAPQAANFANYVFWLHFANGSLVSNEMLAMVSSFLGASAEHPAMGMVNDRAARAYGLVEQRLGEAPYFAGEELTAADIMMVFGLTTMRYFAPRDFADRPNIRAYLQRIAARPAYQRAMAKGDPGMALLLT
jgi:glutathione S-transferase